MSRGKLDNAEAPHILSHFIGELVEKGLRQVSGKLRVLIGWAALDCRRPCRLLGQPIGRPVHEAALDIVHLLSPSLQRKSAPKDAVY